MPRPPLPHPSPGPGPASSTDRHGLGPLGFVSFRDTTLDSTLRRICEVAVDSVAPALHAGITTTVEGRPGTYGWTSPDVLAVDRPQYEAGRGPCLDAFRHGGVVQVEDMHSGTATYPEFCSVAASRGLGSSLSVALSCDGRTAGALNLYAGHPHAFADADRRSALDLAAEAAALVANAQAYWDARTRADDLQQAMLSRAEIEQAKGILMGRLGVDADRAFEFLKQQSQHENVKLRDIAREIVRRAQRPGGAAPPPLRSGPPPPPPRSGPPPPPPRDGRPGRPGDR